MQTIDTESGSAKVFQWWSLGGPVLILGCFWLIWYAGPIKSPALDARAVIHVANRMVDVQIDDQIFHVEDRKFDPLVFTLPAGKHELIMSRAGKILYRESFDLDRGEERVLAAWSLPIEAVDNP